MAKELYSVIFIDDKRDRRWEYNNVSKVETDGDNVLVTCVDGDAHRVFTPSTSTFTRIEINKEGYPHKTADESLKVNNPEQKTAHWEEKRLGYSFSWLCSNCKHVAKKRFLFKSGRPADNYCSHCGTKMASV